ncbi:MAG: helix-turn-helix domain-containing protein [Armatimonadota bacterium]|nr:helix-turn-helix domain-containing protein [Armatimonadota bacterium]
MQRFTGYAAGWKNGIDEWEETRMAGAQPPVSARRQRELSCPVAATIEILNQKWTLHIIRELLHGKRRFNELSHRLGGVNSRTLRDRLKGLEQEGIVCRRVVCAIPPWVEYELTEKGRALNHVIESITDWGMRWMLTPAHRHTGEEYQPAGATPDDRRGAGLRSERGARSVTAS